MMEAAAIFSKFGEQGILFLGMALIIAYLVVELRSVKKEYSLFRDNSQVKYEALMEKVITLTSSCANQLESFNKTITAMTQTLSTWRDEFLRGKGS